MDREKEETQLHYFGFSSNVFQNQYKEIVKMKIESVLRESAEFISKSLNKEIDVDKVTKEVSPTVVKQIEPFVTSMNEKFDKTIEIPDTVPFLDAAGVQSVDKETLETQQAQFEELVKTYMRNKYLLEALNKENHQYKKLHGALTKEELIYANMPNITNELITVKDVEKAYKELE
ncbi:uncharacterized protein LOC134834928 [Culicoides brevitarsis]|uniref:uncharacterized protein LOC134834928 n=1 Tax=Culicoides brevitarsis TaxID=469753 RepID=UPI00307CB0B2